MSRALGVSESTIKTCMREYNISIIERRTAISDDDLDNIERSIHRDFPNAGYLRVRSQYKCALAESHTRLLWGERCVTSRKNG